MKSLSLKINNTKKNSNRESMYELIGRARSPTERETSSQPQHQKKVRPDYQTLELSRMRDSGLVVLVYNKEEAPKVTRGSTKLKTKKVKSSVLNALSKGSKSKPFYILDVIPTKRKGHVQRVFLKNGENISLKDLVVLQQEVQNSRSEYNAVMVRYKNILLSLDTLHSLRNGRSMCKKDTSEINTGVVNTIVQNQMKRMYVLNKRVELLKKESVN